MKKIVLLFCVISMLLPGVSACNVSGENLEICEDETCQSITLFYTRREWGGDPLPPGPAPVPNVITQQVICGDVIYLLSDSPMTIKEIHDEHIVVHFRANGIAPVSPTGGIPVFLEPYWIVDITYGERYFVSTTWASGGLSFTFVFVKSSEVDENITPLCVPTITIKGEEFSIFSDGLNLRNMNLTNSDIEPLKYMVNLVELSLGGNEISDIEPLKYLVNLEFLFLNGNQIYDISALSELINLRHLDLRGNSLSPSQISEIKSALPNCDITY